MKKKILTPFTFAVLIALSASACAPVRQDSSDSQGQDSSSSNNSSESGDSDSSSTNSSSSDDPRPIYDVNAYGSYYQGCLSWTDGADLKVKLYDVIHVGFTGQKYDGIWTTNQAGDQALDNLDMVDQMYSDDNILKTRTKGSGDQGGWDREHCFAKTLMVGANPDTSKIGPLTDFHNLFAAWTTANNSRSNKNYGNVDTPTGTVGDNKFTESTFEPGNTADKGKVSRAVFYMATMYGDAQYGLYVRENTCGTGDKCHGNLSNLLEWSTNPVTRVEYQHNIAVLGYQFNRNPYVDYPGLVDYVFGSKQNEAGELKYIEPTISKLNLSSNELHNYAVKDATYQFTAGVTAFSKTDSVHVVGVKNNFEIDTAAVSYTVSGATDGQVFTTAGTQVITVNAPGQTITYPVTIIEDPVSQMSWKHKFTSSDFSKDTTLIGKVNNTTLDGQTWTEQRGNSAANTVTNSASKGLQLGSSTKSIVSLKLSSPSPFTNSGLTSIKKIAFEGSTAAGTNATLVVKVDGVQVGTSQTITENTSSFNTYMIELSEGLSGQITIEVTGLSKALWIYRIGVTVE